MSLKLQKEFPSDNDLFEGESHKKVAEHMAEVLRTTDNNIIGLEGELGSGKSTIINFLKGTLGSEYKFIEFDAERYHHGNTKKALIEVIYKGLKSGTDVNQNKLDEYRNQALGNIVEYEKKVKSRLSWWTVTFILLSLLSVQMMRYLLIDVNSIMTTEKPVSILVLIIEIFSFLSPALLLGILKIISLNSKNHDAATVGDLFKQNSTDKISETWVASREVGTIELHDALSGFTDKNTLPQNLRFILIIDNLDRIVPEKVKELWSDTELIAGTTNEHFRVIIPYSARQVASSLEMEGHSGREFIAKRIPVTFSVPPLITAGWQDAFKKMWSETVCEVDEASCIEVIQLIERWRPKQYPRITPRLLKKLVNDIHILNLTVPINNTVEPSRFVLIALYILMVRYGDYDIRVLLRDPYQGDLEETALQALDELSDKLKANYAQLNRIFNNDANRWSEYLMSVHYQAPADLARSELIDTPLIEAVKTIDSSALEKLITMWGFSHAWRRCAFGIDMTGWMETVSSLPQTMLHLVQPQIEFALQQLNTNYALQGKEEFRPAFNKSLIKLIQVRSIKIEPFMERQHRYLISELDELQSTPDKIGDENAIKIFDEANQYSQIFNKSLLESMNSQISGDIYASYLLNNEERWINLQIENIFLNDNEIKTMLQIALEKSNEDIFNPGILKFIGVGSQSNADIIKNPQDGLVNLSKISNAFMSGNVIETFIDFRKLIFTTSWNSSNQLNLFAYQTAMQQTYPVEFAAHIIAHMVATNSYNGISTYESHINKNEYIELLFNYFECSISWDKIVSSLLNDDVVPYTKEAIKQLYKKEKINRLSTIQYIKKDYALLKKHIEGVDLMAPVISREEYLIANLNLKEIEALDTDTLIDLFNTKKMVKTHEKLLSLSLSLLANENIVNAFKSISKNNQLIFKQMLRLGRKIDANIDINSFSEWYRSSSPVELTQGENIRFIWSLLATDLQQDILTQLHDILLEVQVSPSNRVKLIHDFGDELNFNEPGKGSSRRGISALFNLAEKDIPLRKWLDRQNYSFSNWPSTESEAVIQYIIDHRDIFPTICSSSRLIGNRIKELESHKTSEDFEEATED
ncbi:P-loop NTPase fold protein [Enterobacteriaceae bacterium C23F]